MNSRCRHAQQWSARTFSARWCKLIQTPEAGSPEPARLCRDVAQPGRALAWGARGRQFKSARPDHYISSKLTSFASSIPCGTADPRSAPTLNPPWRIPSQACEGRSTKRSGVGRIRQFKSARPDHYISSKLTSFASSIPCGTADPRSAPTLNPPWRIPESGLRGALDKAHRRRRIRQLKSARTDHLSLSQTLAHLHDLS